MPSCIYEASYNSIFPILFLMHDACYGFSIDVCMIMRQMKKKIILSAIMNRTNDWEALAYTYIYIVQCEYLSSYHLCQYKYTQKRFMLYKTSKTFSIHGGMVFSPTKLSSTLTALSFICWRMCMIKSILVNIKPISM